MTRHRWLSGMIMVVSSRGAVSGGGNLRNFASLCRGGRTGSFTSLMPEQMVSMTGSGGGHASGKYEVEIDRRMRWPAGKRCATSLSCSVTRYRSPGSRGSGNSCELRCVRLSSP